MRVCFILIILVSVTLSVVFLAISALIQASGDSEPVSASAFECGFENISNIRNPFSMKFFILCILFLIFDIEISLFIPCLMHLWVNPASLYLLVYISLSIFILLLGLLYEYTQGMLYWNE